MDITGMNVRGNRFQVKSNINQALGHNKLSNYQQYKANALNAKGDQQLETSKSNITARAEYNVANLQAGQENGSITDFEGGIIEKKMHRSSNILNKSLEDGVFTKPEALHVKRAQGSVRRTTQRFGMNRFG